MQAGHFLLYSDENQRRIYPCIDDYLVEPDQQDMRADYAQFPILTWCLGLRLLDSLAVPHKRVMVVVNDWQYLAPGDDRAAFYEKHSFLPTSFASEFARYDERICLYQPSRMKSGNGTAPFFGEMNLRNRYHRHVSRLIARKQLPANAVLHARDGMVSCMLPDAGGIHQEVYCSGNTGDCAGEVAEMIYGASTNSDADCFINLYPIVCRAHVERGTQMAVDLLQSSCRRVLNIGFQSTGVHDEEQLLSTAEATMHE